MPGGEEGRKRERKERICPTSPFNYRNVAVEVVDHGGVATGGSNVRSCCPRLMRS
jgi:hypothetical protein